MKRLLSFLILLAAGGSLFGQNKIKITGGEKEEHQVVVRAQLPARAASTANVVTLPDGTHIPAQISTLEKPRGAAELTFVLPSLKAAQVVEVVPTMLNHMTPPPQFHFDESSPEHSDLLYGNRSILQYFKLAHDPKDHFYTFKPFHHLFDPVDGKTILTNGASKTAKDGLYPHHRGLFFGWNKISYDGKTADIWHGTDGVFSQHDKVIQTEAGEVFGKQVVSISWHGKDGQPFALEKRELTAFAAKGGTLIDFHSVLSTDRKSVKLDGDPQHAGFHFRANMEVASKTKNDTYYLRPDGKGKLGETRNWDPKMKDPKTVNLPWNALSFISNGQRYTVLRINHPSNPGESRGSERDYGRFGDYFEYELTPAKPLTVKYRIWVQRGEMTVAECEALREAFVHPPEVKVAAGVQ